MKKIKQEYLIKAPLEKVWEALVTPRIIDKWGAGPAKMSDDEGDNFSLWGGDIWGKNTKVIKNKRLVQDWHAGDWPKPSKVTISLQKKGKNTRVSLNHEDVPEDEFKSISEGWKEYYFGAIKKLLE